MTQRLSIPMALAVALAACLAACSSGSNPVTFSDCGNGVIDPGEQCDDGANNCDTCACLSTCVKATCGDAFIWKGVEQCDTINLANIPRCGEFCTCADLGFAGTTLSCAPDCSFDTSQCGPTFTPTATPTTTPTPPPTATPTATAPMQCGDGLLENGETCDTCPADCMPAPCAATTPEITITVNLAVPAAADVSTVTVLLAYRSSVVSLPGTGSMASSRVKNRPSTTIVTVNDLDYALQVGLSRSSPLPVGRIFTVDFDSCDGAPRATAADFACSVTRCEAAGAAVQGCACTVTVPPEATSAALD